MARLELFFPIKPKTITQYFGNIDPKYTFLGLKGHNGIDFKAYHGQPIYAAHDGTAYYEYDVNQGEGVVLRTNQVYDSDVTPGYSQVYFKTIYWHMCNPVKEPQFTSPVYKAVGYKPDQTGVSNVGVPVRCGDIIGYADNTGLSTGDHLHFALKPQLPEEPNGVWYNVLQSNGYFGAIDPLPFFNGMFAEDYKDVKGVLDTTQTLVDEIKATEIKGSWIIEFLTKISKFLETLLN